MSNSPNVSTFGVWTGLVRATTRIQGEIEAALKAEGLPPLGWYDALWEIEKAGADGIRPFVLQERLLLPQYGLSRLIDRMAASGYVEKRACGEDGRGLIVHQTPAGVAVRARMWPVYCTALQVSLGTRLEGGVAAELAETLAKLAQAYPD
ncbi:hypothetical protein DEA8626_02168 [Defluviimonas aquaemixtae]|uniref:HTH marR-type domain-containing protein n=1 Tax=Albidovulum aquaemixtae TaxID=1542388 RepID=A0A2R8B7Q9_9RHOB|nr:MarR family winged helix-turn-helix transcriptional regulator [Defluviimonas aquaemixtae]SPH18628.1 hypothetical protein DEA8626_02168 [Defluviimonas aquaemixtae]